MKRELMDKDRSKNFAFTKLIVFKWTSSRLGGWNYFRFKCQQWRDKSLFRCLTGCIISLQYGV